MISLSSTATSTGPVLHTPRHVAIFSTLSRLAALYRSRKALGTLTDAQLEDVGLSAEDAHREARRAVWDVPQHWIR